MADRLGPPDSLVLLIRWSSVNVSGSVNIELSRDGGATFETLAANTANDGVESWTVTGPASGQAVIRVSSVSQPSLSDSSDGQFILRQPPAAAPVITKVTPGAALPGLPGLEPMHLGIVNEGTTTRLTLTGSELNDASLSLVQPSGSSSCAATVRPVSVDPAGQSMQVDVDVPASADCGSSYSSLVVSNQFGDAVGVLQIVPAGLKLTSVTPTRPQPGRVYVMAVTGYHLQGATVTAADPGRLKISTLGVNRLAAATPAGVSLPQDLITALVEVPQGAASGQTSLTVSGPAGSETLALTIGGQAQAQGGAGDLPLLVEATTPIYFEPPSVLIAASSGPPPATGGRSAGGRLGLYQFQHLFSLVRCSDAVCPDLSALPQGAEPNLLGLVVGVAANLELEFEVCIDIDTDPTSPNFGSYRFCGISLCLRLDGWVGIIGSGSEFFELEICFGKQSNRYAGGRRELINARLVADGCVAVEPPTVDGGRFSSRLRLTDCCPGSVWLEFDSLRTPAGETFSPADSDVVDLVALEVSPDPTTCPPPTAVAQFIRPPVLSLPRGSSGQLLAQDGSCRRLSGFPTNLQITPKTAASRNGSSVATVNSQTGVVTAGNKTGTVFLDVLRLSDSVRLRSAKANCQTGDTPWVQVGPIFIYLRFDDVESYLRGSFPRGLGLSNAEADQVKMGAVQRVQTLYNAVMANVTVTSTPPAGWTPVEFARDFDGVVTIEIHFETDSNGDPKPVRQWNQAPSVVYGEGPVNELNWLVPLPGTFGLDALKAKGNGVFVNRLPLRRPDGLRVTIEQIATAIGNVAAHEAGHALGLVPNDGSKQLRDERLDPRFGGVDFDGSSTHHSSASNDNQIMTAAFRELSDREPVVLTTDPRFRPRAGKDGAYLRVILPRP